MIRLTTAWCFNWFNPFVIVPVGFLPIEEKPTVAPGSLSRVLCKPTRNTPSWDWSRIKGMRIDPFYSGRNYGRLLLTGYVDDNTDFGPH